MKRISLLLFIISAIGELLSMFVDAPLLHTFCKPALLITLTLYYISSVREAREPVSYLVVGALLFSWGGDVLLMYQGELFFMLGLISFLIAHVCYIFAFHQFRNDDAIDSLQGLHKIRFAFPIILYGTGLVVVLYPHLGEMKIPVMVYSGVITLMTLNALFRFRRTSTSSFALVFAGAILFMISDSILAVNKFLSPVSLGGFWIMGTYISAQFLIIRGLLKHTNWH